ncbi:MAG: heme exporter protein CcmD [Aquincola sp.]|nr:heme exporter protein CcmD [Aquincola sp.]
MSDGDFAAFLEMGGYALYVWGALGMCGVAAFWEAVMLAHRRRRVLEDLRADLWPAPAPERGHGASDIPS